MKITLKHKQTASLIARITTAHLATVFCNFTAVSAQHVAVLRKKVKLEGISVYVVPTGLIRKHVQSVLNNVKGQLICFQGNCLWAVFCAIKLFSWNQLVFGFDTNAQILTAQQLKELSQYNSKSDVYALVCSLLQNPVRSLLRTLDVISKHNRFCSFHSLTTQPMAYDNLIDQIAQMTAGELMLFVQALSAKFNVSTTTSTTTNVSANLATNDQPTKQEQTEFNIRLTSIGNNKVAVIKTVKAITGLGLKEAKTLVDAVPCVLKQGLDKQTAQDNQKQLTEVGATAEIT